MPTVTVGGYFRLYVTLWGVKICPQSSSDFETFGWTMWRDGAEIWKWEEKAVRSKLLVNDNDEKVSNYELSQTLPDLTVSHNACPGTSTPNLHPGGLCFSFLRTHVAIGQLQQGVSLGLCPVFILRVSN